MANKDLDEIRDELKQAEDRLKEILEEHGTGAHEDEDVPPVEEPDAENGDADDDRDVPRKRDD